MRVAIIGGGINGLCCAWEIAKQNNHVTLFEKDKLMQKTSRSSSKLLHGGLRYLEHGEFKLVREALKDRDSWIRLAPHLACPLRIILPIYTHSRRNRWVIATGLFLYKILAKNSSFHDFKWVTRKELISMDPSLEQQGLTGGYEFYDGQMDDFKLGLWVAKQAKKEGVEIFENSEILSISTSGEIIDASSKSMLFDRVVNVAGPWSERLCEKSNYKAPYELDLIRGSHLIIDKTCGQAYILEVNNEKRVFFILPWKGKTLIGTTEVRQDLEDLVECSQEEEEYLINAYNKYKIENISSVDIVEKFSGIRPLIKSKRNPLEVSREYAIHKDGKLIVVLGGKWTTSISLAKKVASLI